MTLVGSLPFRHNQERCFLVSRGSCSPPFSPRPWRRRRSPRHRTIARRCRTAPPARRTRSGRSAWPTSRRPSEPSRREGSSPDGSCCDSSRAISTALPPCSGSRGPGRRSCVARITRFSFPFAPTAPPDGFVPRRPPARGAYPDRRRPLPAPDHPVPRWTADSDRDGRHRGPFDSDPHRQVLRQPAPADGESGRGLRPGAVGISAFSPALAHWAQGGPIAIHGTNAPGMIGFAVSHGCLRVRNADIVKLLRLAEEGSPVNIRA